jgi:hypothetical protein
MTEQRMWIRDREEVSLRDRIRELEQDEQRKMEQERQATQGNRRNLDHLKRGDQQSAETGIGQVGQVDGSEGSGSNDQSRLNEERGANKLGEEELRAHRLNSRDQRDELMGKLRMTGRGMKSGHPWELTTDR